MKHSPSCFYRTYDSEGAYRATLRVFNLASEFEMTNRVPVWAEIKNLTTLAYYLPFLPIGEEMSEEVLFGVLRKEVYS